MIEIKITIGLQLFYTRVISWLRAASLASLQEPVGEIVSD